MLTKASSGIRIERNVSAKEEHSMSKRWSRRVMHQSSIHTSQRNNASNAKRCSIYVEIVSQALFTNWVQENSRIVKPMQLCTSSVLHAGILTIMTRVSIHAIRVGHYMVTLAKDVHKADVLHAQMATTLLMGTAHHVVLNSKTADRAHLIRVIHANQVITIFLIGVFEQKLMNKKLLQLFTKN